VRIPDGRHKERLRTALENALRDHRLAWDLGSDGQYVLRSSAPGEPDHEHHRFLMENALARRGGSA
jgi:hypothetical protein